MISVAFVLLSLKQLLSHLQMLLFIPVKIFVIASFTIFLHILFIAHKKVQNIVARIVTNSFHFLQIIPTLKFLHWLPLLYRINFKICCITHHALSLGELFYVSNLQTH